jgi:primase-polymerase (primpol)-like protein
VTAPDDLIERDQWVLWCYVTRVGKRTKVPYQITGSPADSTASNTWTTFEDALRAWRRDSRRYVGLGFVFCREDPFVGIDLDDSLDGQGRCKPWARGIVERFADTYMEISPSGRGLKMWARGSLPANLPGVQVGDGAIELYDHARYFAVTGRAYRGAPLQIEDHTADLLALYDRLTAGKKRWILQPLPGGRIPYGRQHNTLVSLCGTLRAWLVCEEAIEACLQAVNEKQCEKPGPRDHITGIVQSTRRWSANERAIG